MHVRFQLDVVRSHRVLHDALAARDRLSKVSPVRQREAEREDKVMRGPRVISVDANGLSQKRDRFVEPPEAPAHFSHLSRGLAFELHVTGLTSQLARSLQACVCLVQRTEKLSNHPEPGQMQGLEVLVRDLSPYALVESGQRLRVSAKRHEVGIHAAERFRGPFEIVGGAPMLDLHHVGLDIGQSPPAFVRDLQPRIVSAARLCNDFRLRSPVSGN